MANIQLVGPVALLCNGFVASDGAKSYLGAAKNRKNRVLLNSVQHLAGLVVKG
jgi:hypothetical protein